MSRALRLERRASPRKLPHECGWFASARLRPGRDVRILDVSDRGALVEGVVRLVPGASTELHMIGVDCRHTLRARVVRCHVSALDGPAGVRYRAALEFEVAQSLLDAAQSAPRQTDSGSVVGSQFSSSNALELRFE